MVVKIKSPHSLQRALNYNEKKIQRGQAECIHAGNYILNPQDMNFYQKMERLQDLISLNERTKKSNTLHISLNFDPSEKITKETLTKIAETYMDKIGFGEQPYLVYQHHDAGHPHIHILTTNIQADGKRIDTYNIGRNQSEIGRKEIEQEFNLVRAQAKKTELFDKINPVDVQKVQYGKTETRRSITNVLDAVLNHFKYTSLAEFNAVLKQYNVVADRGAEDGLIFRSGGLFYKLLDDKGNKVGVPIKASLIYSNPTLKTLETKFSENEIARQPDKKKLKTSIDWVLNKAPDTLDSFIAALQKEKIQSILRQNKDGLIYGITFIDYRTRSVFNGSDLGKEYSVGGIQNKIGEKENKSVETSHNKDNTPKTNQPVERSPIVAKEIQPEQDANKEDLLQQLTTTEKTSNRLPFELVRKKKKKKNKNL